MQKNSTTPLMRRAPIRALAVAVTAMTIALFASLLPAAADRSEVPASGNQLLAQSLTVGQDHACAVLSTGYVKCWGGNGQGQLGVGDTEDRGDDPNEMGDELPFVDLGTGRTATAISAGFSHTCAIRDDGSVVCWGDNSLGQLGAGLDPAIDVGDDDGEMGDALTAVALPDDAIVIESGWLHSCAIVTGGDLYCWGINGFGQLGQGNKTTLGDDPGEVAGMSPVALPTGRTAVGVTAGTAHTCVLMDNNQIVCFGNGGLGRLGTGASNEVGSFPTQMGDALVPVDLGVGRSALAVSAGQDHTCVLRDDGDVVCFGRSNFGQLGQGSTDNWGTDPSHMGDNLIPVDLGAGVTATGISTNSNTTCARLDDGRSLCWGSNLGAGPLGQSLPDAAHLGDQPDELGANIDPIDLGVDDTVQFITNGGNSTCAVLSSAILKCWGDGSQGMNGQGNQLDWGNAAGRMGDFLPAIDLGSATPPTTTTTGGGGGSTTTTTGGGGGSTTTTTGGGGGSTTTTPGGGGTTTTLPGSGGGGSGIIGGATTTTLPGGDIEICDTSPRGFTDIVGSFAEDDINCLADLGVINGFRPDLFGLKSVLTREQGVAMIARLYRDVINQPCDTSSHPFLDIPVGHYVNIEAACLNDVDLVNGTGPTEFGLLQPLTRQQVAAVLGRFWLDLGRGCPSLEHPFTDLVEGGFAEPFIACLSNLQDPAGGSIINGRTPTTYDPFATITREEMAALLGRIYRAYLDAIF
ncbi:MAG: hypothetical protein AAGE98_13905 [Actinomycetota bacterium]